MSPRLILARPDGIPIRVGASTLVVGAIISWTLATGIIPWAAPDATGTQTWVGGLLGGILFLASLLAHELGHAMVAKRRGIEVEDVSLWLLGGVARLRSEPRTPGDEAAIAAAGPAVSFAVSLLAFAAALAAGAAGQPTTAAVLGWLALSNGLLAVFNLLPGLPLDGGRLLHAALWAASGDRVSSRTRAAHAGRVVGGAIGLVGLTMFAFGSFGGLWTALVGWFVYQSAAQLVRSGRLQAHLDDARVADAMRAVPTVAAWHESLPTAIHRASQMRSRFVFVTGPEGWVSGLIDMHHLGRFSAHDAAHLTAGQAASPVGGPDLPFVESRARLADALDVSATGSFVVVDAGRVVGVVTPGDAAQAAEFRRLVDLRAVGPQGPTPSAPAEPPSATMASSR